MTYALLVAPALLLAAAAAVWALRRDRRGWAALAIAAAVVLGLTAVFDTAMIAADLFRYDDALLLGPHIGLAPIEDFAYALIAVLVAAASWRLWPARASGAGAAREQTDD